MDMVVLRCFFTGLEGRRMEREAFIIYETFSKLLLKARVEVSQGEEPGLARYRVGSHECLLKTSPLIWSKAQTLEPAWLVLYPTSPTYYESGQIK